MQDGLSRLKLLLAEIKDLGRVAAVLDWDQQVMMPPAGAESRAEQLTTLGRVIHERATSPELGRAVEEAALEVEELDPDSDDARLVRIAKRDFEKAVRVPTDLQAEIIGTSAEAYGVWVEARRESDYPRFRPYLEKTIDLSRRYVDCFPPAEDPYDVLLDDYEPEASSADVRRIFARLKEALIPLVRTIAASGEVDDAPLAGRLPVEPRIELQRRVLELFGVEPQAWRLDPTVHPFETAIAIGDIRLTTRYEADGFESLFSSMHEFGHGLYEHQVAPALDRGPLARGASLGWHESQSLLWENLVGRSRAFADLVFPSVAELFPERFSGHDAESLFRMVNKVEPSFIRVEADQATYNLHVALRFELEQDMLAGRVELDELPQIWNARMEEYLGVVVPNDRLGVLQDVHWSHASLGYFPTYTLGFLLAAQLWERIEGELPGLEEDIRRGEFAELRQWLRESLHRHGRKFMPAELQQQLLGGPVDPEAFLRHLRGKLTAVYGESLLASAS
ncbi:MAG: carboxypeptidase M32 [Gaiellaceae bacterium]